MQSAKEKKRLYDIEYRRKNKDKIKQLKAIRYQRDKHKYSDREKKYRRKVQAKHNEYCMQPDYVAKKRIWDVVYRNMKRYGEFWESAIIVNQIEIEVRRLIPKNERLGYKRNVKAIIAKSARKRFEKVIIEIMNGDNVDKNRIKNFAHERKQLLESMILK